MIIQFLVQSSHTVNTKSICRNILLLGQYSSFLIIKEASQIFENLHNITDFLLLWSCASCQNVFRNVDA